MIINPPPVTVDPPPITVDPPPITVTPPPITVTPPAITVNPPSMTVNPPPVTVAGVRVSPPSITVKPPSITVTPPAITVRPPPVTVDPPAMKVDPPPITVNPPAIQVDPPPPLLVGSGNLPPELAPFDSAVRAYMKKYQISAGVLAVAKDKKIVLSRGYGWLGPTFSEAVQPDTPMRIASVVKPITRAAIRKLVKDGKLALQDKAFGDSLLGSKRLNRPGHAVDPRLTDITIQHLIDHKGGWDRYQAPLFDPMMQTTLISMATGRQPAGANDVIRFMIGQPLQRDPGTKEIYSNFGYCVLGRIIEKVSGKKYIDYLRDDLLGALDITSVEVSRSLPTDRNRREPVYVSREPPVPNVMMPATPPVPACDGGLHLEAMDSHGGLIVSAPDLVRFAAKFNNDGTPYDDEPAGTAHEGSLPGTTARLQWRMDNVLIAAIFNLRHPPEGRKFDPDKFNPEALSPNAAEIGAALNKAADSITRWP